MKRKILILIEKTFLFFINHQLWLPGFLFIFLDKIIWKDKDYLEIFLTKIKPDVLKKLADQKVLLIFNYAVKNTPAYKKFLLKNNVVPNKIKSINDFKKNVPITTKENYIKAYSLEERCINGKLPKDGIIFRSAGVEGNPTYWTQALKEEDRFEVFVPFGIDYIFDYKKKNYKLLNCWAFGTWPTAIDFTKSARRCGQMVNIGTNSDELIFTLKLLGNKYNYLISGYPPFLRNIIHKGEQNGIKWNEYKIDIITGGEGFVEEWRDFLKSKLGKKSIIASAYGSTDKGLGEGFETPLTIVLRNIIRINQTYLFDKKHAKEICDNVFGDRTLMPRNEERASNFVQTLLGRDPLIEKRLPMIFQTVPITYYEEEIKNGSSSNSNRSELVTTVLKLYSSQPVIRYNIQDDSGVIDYKKVIKISKENSYDLESIITNLGYKSNKILCLPFMYVYGRTDGTISIDGQNVYPEEVGRMIENIEWLADEINSFMLNITSDYRLGIDLELKQGVESRKFSHYAKTFRDKLIDYSNGYRLLKEGDFKSSNIEIRVFDFGQGPFKHSPLVDQGIIKYQYIGKKVFGK